MNSSCIALLDLSNDLLDFSKIEAVLSLLRPKAQSKRLRLEARLAPRLPATLLGDALRRLLGLAKCCVVPYSLLALAPSPCRRRDQAASEARPDRISARHVKMF